MGSARVNFSEEKLSRRWNVIRSLGFFQAQLNPALISLYSWSHMLLWCWNSDSLTSVKLPSWTYLVTVAALLHTTRQRYKQHRHPVGFCRLLTMILRYVSRMVQTPQTWRLEHSFWQPGCWKQVTITAKLNWPHNRYKMWDTKSVWISMPDLFIDLEIAWSHSSPVSSKACWDR